MTRHSDPAPFSEAEVTLVDHNAGHQWDLDDDYFRPTEPSLMPPATQARSTLTADGLRQQRAWKRGVTDARRSLAARRDQREALSRVLAAAKPRSQPTPGPIRAIPRLRAATQNP